MDLTRHCLHRAGLSSVWDTDARPMCSAGPSIFSRWKCSAETGLAALGVTISPGLGELDSQDERRRDSSS